MEHYWNVFDSNSDDTGRISADRRVGGSNSNHNAWEFVEPVASRQVETAGAFHPAAAAAAALGQEDYHRHRDERQQQRRVHCSSSLYLGCGSQYYNPDPHLMCLKLGKRHYFEDMVSPSAPLGVGERLAAVAGSSSVKKCKVYSPSWIVKQMVEEVPPPVGLAAAAASPAVVSKCQVEGCGAVLVDVKDYHRRHKVCEMHAKAPKVVVHGVEQRFCQQCSRFHKVGEFDESKRSCRRRLAGHNERRRKSSQEHSHAKKSFLATGTKTMAASRCAPCFPSSSECALSLLSSQNPINASGWIRTSLTSPAQFPARCSAALRELISEKRACSKQVNTSDHVMEMRSNQGFLGSRGDLTLDLMQASQILSLHRQDGSTSNTSGDHKSTYRDGNGSEDQLWKLPLGY